MIDVSQALRDYVEGRDLQKATLADLLVCFGRSHKPTEFEQKEDSPPQVLKTDKRE